MTEVKTEPVRAQHVPDQDKFRAESSDARIPGSFRIEDEPDSDGEQTFWYCCPCGCGSIGPLTVGNGFKPPHTSENDATWKWNGSLDAPTLEPSVHHRGHWHGWLREGVWVSC